MKLNLFQFLSYIENFTLGFLSSLKIFFNSLWNVLLVHHATIKDLQKQVRQMHRKIATIDSSRKSTRVKTIAKKTTLKKKSSQKKSRKP
jgi:hypothetical protein